MDNAEWLDALRSEGNRYDRALEELRKILVRGLRSSLAGKTKSVGREFDALVEDFAQEALIRILDNLDSFRGESKFTTWAMKIGVRIGLTELRRKRWKNFSLDKITEAGSMPTPFLKASKRHSDPSRRAEQNATMEMVQEIIRESLTEKQRIAMTALGMKGVPLEEVADRLDTNRNALYKLMHDARLKMRKAVEDRGFTVGELLETFEDR